MFLFVIVALGLEFLGLWLACFFLALRLYVFVLLGLSLLSGVRCVASRCVVLCCVLCW